jgi:hypothetical protein
MTGAFRWTLLVLGRPWLVASALAAVVGFATAVTVGTFLTAARPGGSRLGEEPLLLADMHRADVAAELVGRPLMITGAVVLAVAAAHVGGTFSTGLIRVVAVRRPDRVRWLLGTWAALSAVTVALSGVASGTVLLAAHVLAGSSGVDTSAWSSGEGLVAVASRAAGVAVALIGFTSAGVALAVLLRSGVAAMGVGLAYGLVEGLAAGLLGRGGGLLPGQVLAEVSRGLGDGPSPAAALLAPVLVGGCLAVSAVVLRLRDITE